MIGSGNGAAKLTVSANNYLSINREIMFRLLVLEQLLVDISQLIQFHQKLQFQSHKQVLIQRLFHSNMLLLQDIVLQLVLRLLPSSTTGVTTLTSSKDHGLVAGNRVQIVSSSGATPYLNYGDYIVKSVSSVGTFAVTGQVKDPITGTLISARNTKCKSFET